MRWFVRIGGAVLGLVLVLVGILVANTARQGSRQRSVPTVAPTADGPAVAEVLSDVIRVPTVSRTAGEWDQAALDELQELLVAHFPRVHEELQVRAVGGGALLYTWPGADPTLPVGVVMAHQDVVPADDAAGWTVPPFEGRVQGGFVWGRGALDDKQNLVGELWAVESLLARGFRPERTLHLVFGHDEETGGLGAEAAAAAIPGPIAFVLDEGGMVLHEAMDGLQPPAALVGVAEKGYVSLELAASVPGGHASMPPPSTAAGKLAEAIVALEASPMPARMPPPVAALFDAVGPEMDAPMSLVLTNRWLFEPVLLRVLSGKPSTNALLRSTAAVTQLKGSEKDNVLPRRATAVVNVRILPGDSIASVTDHVRAVVGPEIEVTPLSAFGSEPSPMSVAEGPAWDVVSTAIRETFPDAVVAPFLMVGATDARRFAARSDAVYRFQPVRFRAGDLDRLHGVDERVAVAELPLVVAFYERLFERGGARW